MEDKEILFKELVQLAKLAIAGKQKESLLYVRKLINRHRMEMPELSEQLGGLLNHTSNHSTPTRGAAVAIMPVDLDSRLHLAKPEYPVELEAEPIWDETVREKLQQIIAEQGSVAQLFRQGLEPAKSAIFTGPPGVGKTLAARWLAASLRRPLIVLDLSAVMSSFLGRTGSNLRNILDYAKGIECVLLLDEFDAIAKRRDDAVEIGELKRLVTVLLQEIDGWPSSGLLIAATNHKELLDPAVWRRFDVIVDFPMPHGEQVRQAVSLYLGNTPEVREWSSILATALEGMSFAEIERELLRVRREAVVHQQPLQSRLQQLIRERVRGLRRPQRAQIATALVRIGLSQREAHEWTGVSRDTMRKTLRG
jgi:SpoVK/Ycf46/Vps4 family AAA+-type ATPase